MSQHKKLVEGTLYEEVSSASYSENDISDSLKNGILYLEDPIDHVRVHRLLFRTARTAPAAWSLLNGCFCVTHRRGRHTISS